MAYNVERVKKRIKENEPSKKNELYDSHLYWSQKPYNICDILIEELSDVGDTVFDPFLGSGVTVLEAIKSKYRRKAIGCEINDAPLLIVKTLTQKYDFNNYHKDASSLINKMINLNTYYTTKCEICGSEGIISTVIFDMPDRKEKISIKRINYVCPICKKRSKKGDNDDYIKMTRKYDIFNIDNQILLENTKLAVHEGEKIDQIFTSRNFKVLDVILEYINDYPNSVEIFKYIIMSMLHLCKITDTHSNSQWPLWIPKRDCVEKNIIDIFCKRIKKFEDVIIYINNNYGNYNDCKLLQKGSQYISDKDIKNGSIDLIITDPPYLGQVAYSEYMQLYKPFLGLDFNLNDEIIVTSSTFRKRSEEDYFKELNKVISICAKKIKSGGYFCMYFHDNNLAVWNKLIKCMTRNNFKYLSQEHILKKRTLKNIISPKKSLSGDAILFFIKDDFYNGRYSTTESIDEIEANIVQHIKTTIRLNGEKSTPELYDEGLIEYLIYNDWLEIISKKYKSLVDIFEKYLLWNVETNKWKLAA